MTTIDARTPDTRTPCPRCHTLEAYPAIVATPDGPQFRLVCEFCGSHRDFPAPTLTRACRVCGCTDLDCSGCVQRTGHPCAWVPGEDDLCTACIGEVEAARLV